MHAAVKRQSITIERIQEKARNFIGIYVLLHFPLIGAMAYSLENMNLLMIGTSLILSLTGFLGTRVAACPPMVAHNVLAVSLMGQINADAGTDGRA
jgi:hypothetical protein